MQKKLWRHKNRRKNWYISINRLNVMQKCQEKLKINKSIMENAQNKTEV